MISGRSFMKGGVVIVLCLSISMNAHAQKALTVRDTTNIYVSARNILDEFNVLLNFLADPSNSEDERARSIANKFEQPGNMFMSSKVNIDDDTDPGAAATSTYSIEQYLKAFNQAYQNSDENSIEFTVKSFSHIMKSDSKVPYLKVHYSELFKGKSMSRQSYKRQYRYLEIWFKKKGDGDQWQGYISLVKSESSNSLTDDGSHDYPIDATGGDTQPLIAEKKDDLYYQSVLWKGIQATAENKYADAYRYLADAREAGAGNISKDADVQINILKGHIKSLTMEYDSFLYNVLKIKAQELDHNNKYEEAKKYYELAKGIYFSDKDIDHIINHLNAEIGIKREMEQAYIKGLYEQAVAGYNNALASGHVYSDMYLGLAKCYAQLNNDAKAKYNFALAIKFDPGNVDAYREQGKYYEAKNTAAYYDSAYASLVNCINRAEYKADPAVKAIAGEASYCKAMNLFKKNLFHEAADSFLSAIVQKPDYKEAICYLAASYCGMKDYDHAREYLEQVLKIDDKYPDAIFWHGKMQAQADWDKNRKEGIREMASAIELINEKNVNWYLWNGDLAYFYELNGDYDEAVRYYNVCLSSGNTRYIPFYLSTGQCYHKSNRDEKAREEYLKYKAACDNVHCPLDPDYNKFLDELNNRK